MRQRRTDVAEVDLPDLLGAEVADHLFGVLARELAAAFEPGPAAQADADVRTVGDLQGSLVAVEVAEDATRDAGEHGHRRVIGMNPDPDAGPLRDRGDLLDEIGVVLPDLFLRVRAAVGERLLPGLAVPESLPVRARQVEFPGIRTPDRRVAAAPDPIAHMSVRRIVNPRLSQVAKVLLVLLDLRVPPGEVQRDFRHVVHGRVADVPHGDARVRIALLDPHEAFGGTQIARRPDAHVLGADLLEEEQLLVRRRGG